MKSLIVSILLIFITTATQAQFNPDHDAYWGKSNVVRVDLLWHSEGANVVAKKAGNVSIVSDTRVGLNGKWELSTPLLMDVGRPLIAAKRLWFEKNDWYFGTKFSVSNAYTGMTIAKKHHNIHIVNDSLDVPIVVEFGAEPLVSKAFRSDPNCSSGNEFLILTGGIGLYYGHNFSDFEQIQSAYHFLANRSATLVERGVRMRVKFWADWMATRWLAVHGGAAFHWGMFRRPCAAEINAEAEFFITSKFSLKAGGSLSFANYTTTSHKVGAVPLFDITYYFGSSIKNKNGLFDPAQRGLQRGAR